MPIFCPLKLWVQMLRPLLYCLLGKIVLIIHPQNQKHSYVFKWCLGAPVPTPMTHEGSSLMRIFSWGLCLHAFARFLTFGCPMNISYQAHTVQPLSRSRPMIRLSGIEWMCLRKILNRNSAQCSSLVHSASSTPMFGGPHWQSSLRWGCSYRRLMDCVLNGKDLKQRFLKVHQ